MRDFVPIRITEIIVELVSRPRKDQSLWSGQCDVPFQLSAKPETEWSRLFIQTWNSSAWTSSHRRVVCDVVADRVWLRGTTVEEIEEKYKEILKTALAYANRGFVEYIVRTSAEGDQLRKEREAYTLRVREAAKNIEFD